MTRQQLNPTPSHCGSPLRHNCSWEQEQLLLLAGRTRQDLNPNPSHYAGRHQYNCNSLAGVSAESYGDDGPNSMHRTQSTLTQQQLLD